MSERVPAELRQEIATIARDITAPVSGFVLQPRDDVLVSRGGGRGLKIYDEIKRDPHAGAVLRKRKMAVVAREWSVEAASDAPADEAAAELVREMLKGLPFDRLCLGLLDAVLKGYSVAELIWDVRRIDGRTYVLPVDARVRNARRFVFDRDGQLRLLTWSAPMEGEALPDRKFIVMRFGQEETEDPYGLGLGHMLFWPVFFKRQGIAYWMNFAEKFGSPTAVGEYPPGTSTDDQNRLMAALAALSQDSGIIFPQGMQVRFLEAMRSGSIDTYERLAGFMNLEISEGVLGETLSTSVGDSGSRALGEVHNGVRIELTDADADLLSETLNRTLLQWVIELNMPGAGVPSVWRRKPDEEDLNQRAGRDKQLMDAGWEPEAGPNYFERVYGERWVRKPAAPAPAVGPAFAAPTPPRTDGDLVEQLEEFADPVVEGLVEQIRRIVMTSRDWAEVQQRLLALHPSMSVDDLAAVMARAMAVADLTGRAEAGNG